MFSDSGPKPGVFIWSAGAALFQWTEPVCQAGCQSVETGPLRSDAASSSIRWVLLRGAISRNRPGAVEFTMAVPKVDSVTPEKAEIGSLVTIKGSGFGTLSPTRAHAR